jgi:hypothetical protein
MYYSRHFTREHERFVMPHLFGLSLEMTVTDESQMWILGLGDSSYDGAHHLFVLGYPSVVLFRSFARGTPEAFDSSGCFGAHNHFSACAYCAGHRYYFYVRQDQCTACGIRSFWLF